MSKKAKTASKNNPNARAKSREFFHGGKKIKPVKIIIGSRNFFGAEYEDSSLVEDKDGNPLAWKAIV